MEATGKYAKGECQRCGWPWPLLELRKEWTGYKVCPDCYEPKHPQLYPRRHEPDAESLGAKASPTQDDMGTTIPWTINDSRPNGNS